MTSSITANTTNLLSNTLNNHTTPQETSAIAPVTTIPLAVAPSKSATKEDDSVNFSSRGMKIQSISKEFFSNGGLQMSDISQYIKRLQNDGFLTDQQAEKLGVNNKNAGSGAAVKQQVMDFIDNFKQAASGKEGNDSLVDLLDRAKKSINSLGAMNSKYSNTAFTAIDIEFKRYLESDDAKQWSGEQLQSLSQVSNLLSVASDLKYGTENSKATNSYAQVSGY